MDFTFQAIRDRIKENLQNPTNQVEGGFSMDNVQAVSQELAQIMAMEVLPIPDQVLLDTAKGIMLDRRAKDFNEQRNPAKKSIGKLKFIGTVGIIIPAGTIAVAEDLEFTTLESVTISETKEAVATAECFTEGQIGNVEVGKISDLKVPLNGVDSVSNEEKFIGGVDEEQDDSLRNRILEKIQRPITSGNKYHYEYWAKQVSGVGKAKAVSCWNGNGTVKVIVLSDTFDVPDDTIVQNVKSHIELNRPIGADVTVVKAVPLLVTVNVTVVLAEGYDISSVKLKITNDLQEYLKQIAFDEKKHLSYYKVGDIIFGVDGVLDISSYTLNEGTVSLQTGLEEFFKLQEVVVNGS